MKKSLTKYEIIFIIGFCIWIAAIAGLYFLIKNDLAPPSCYSELIACVPGKWFKLIDVLFTILTYLAVLGWIPLIIYGLIIRRKK